MRLSIKEKKQIAALQLAQHIGAGAGFDSAYTLLALTKLAASLQKRYEAACNYQWATTEKYQRATKRLEEKAIALAIELNVAIEFQTDPRGWPLILSDGDFSIRLG